VIVRIGSIRSNSSQAAAYRPSVHWVRKLGSALVLAATLVALTLIVMDQHGPAVEDGPAFGAGAGLSSSPVVPGGLQAARLAPAEETRYRALAEFLAKRYRVSREVAFELVGLAHRAGEAVQLDPLLIIAVIAIESSFNPIAESVAGAKGLMQIIPKYHLDKLDAFGGERSVFDPAINIQVGAQILREYIRLTGNLGIALQMYSGALDDREDTYTNKVLGMKRRLQAIVSQAPAPASAPAPIKTAAVKTAAGRSGASADIRLD
jgi:hypothetical protein